MRCTIATIAALFASVAVAAPAVKRDSYTGAATYFYQNGNAGACGWVSQDSSYVVALQTDIYNGGHCGQTVTLSANGVQIQALVADECPTCQPQGIDLSVGAFSALTNGNLGEGEFTVTYWFD